MSRDVNRRSARRAFFRQVALVVTLQLTLRSPRLQHGQRRRPARAARRRAERAGRRPVTVGVVDADEDVVVGGRRLDARHGPAEAGRLGQARVDHQVVAGRALVTDGRAGGAHQPPHARQMGDGRRGRRPPRQADLDRHVGQLY